MTLRLNGDNSGFTEIKAADTAGDNSIKLPASNGSANQLLQNGGTAGELQYTSAGGGLHYDSSGRLLVGTSSSSTNDTVVIQGNSAGAAFGANLRLRRNATIGDGNGIGEISFENGSGNIFATITGLGDGVSGGVNGYPGRLSFATENLGSDDGPSERLRITNNGTIRLLNSPGIDFSGISAANETGSDATSTGNLLDEYEEGSWNPTFYDSSFNPITGTPNGFGGTYTRVGNIVTCRGQYYNATSTTFPASFFIRKPFTASAGGVVSMNYGTVSGAGLLSHSVVGNVFSTVDVYVDEYFGVVFTGGAFNYTQFRALTFMFTYVLT